MKGNCGYCLIDQWHLRAKRAHFSNALVRNQLFVWFSMCVYAVQLGTGCSVSFSLEIRKRGQCSKVGQEGEDVYGSVSPGRKFWPF